MTEVNDRMGVRLHRFLPIAFCCALLILAGCRERGEYVRVEGQVWYTAYHIDYESSENLEDSILKIFAEVDQSLSMFNDSSLVSRINRGDTAARCDALLGEVMLESERVYRASGGAFDPTVCTLVDLWGFGKRVVSQTVIDEEAIREALSHVGLDKIHIGPDGRVAKGDSLIRLDFSGIAKGYACDLIARLFERHSIANYLIEVGGEIVAKGNNPEGAQWRIMIENPAVSPDSVGSAGLGVISTKGVAMATSGSYRHVRRIGGRLVSHILNPLTGRPEDGRVLSATVTAPTCMAADALATACMVLAPDSALWMLTRRTATEGLLVVASDSGAGYVVMMTEGFPRLTK